MILAFPSLSLLHKVVRGCLTPCILGWAGCSAWADVSWQQGVEQCLQQHFAVHWPWNQILSTHMQHPVKESTNESYPHRHMLSIKPLLFWSPSMFPALVCTGTLISWAVFKKLFQSVDNFGLWRLWRDDIACITRLLWCFMTAVIPVHKTLVFDCNYNGKDGVMPE